MFIASVLYNIAHFHLHVRGGEPRALMTFCLQAEGKGKKAIQCFHILWTLPKISNAQRYQNKWNISLSFGLLRYALVARVFLHLLAI